MLQIYYEDDECIKYIDISIKRLQEDKTSTDSEEFVSLQHHLKALWRDLSYGMRT